MLRDKRAVVTFEGYTIDLWTRELKRLDIDSGIVEILPFNSTKGAALLRTMDAWMDDFWEAVRAD